MANSLSITTGYSTPSSTTAWRTLARSCSKPNSGAWTPTTTSPRSAYRSCHALTYGSVRSQLTQEYVQKSTSTGRPCSPAAVSGSVLSQTGARSSAVSGLRRSADELLSAIDVIGRSCQGGVGHEVDRECRDVRRSHDASDRKRRAELLAPGVERVAEQRSRQRRVD